MNYQKHIELTELHSPPTKQIRRLVELANDKGYYGICLLPQNLRIARKHRSKDLKIITVAGFPPIHTYSLINTDPKYAYWLGLYLKKEIQKIRYIVSDNIADELDVVFPFYWYSKNRKKLILHFLKGVKKLFKKPVKVICELGTIFKTEKFLKDVCSILEESNIDYFKTNSGLIKQNFTDLYSMIKYAKEYTKLKIKAAGGIRTIEQVEKLLELGVERIGTSSIEGEDGKENI